MFSKFNKRVDAIFLDKNSSDFNISESVNVILSPSLYWVKKVSLPVKRLRDVKGLMESLFEDILPNGVYSYFAYKRDDDFYIFAYEDKLVIDALRNKGITSSQVNNVYFAQSEFSHVTEPIKINETQTLYEKDEILVVVPSTWVSNAQEMDLKDLTLSKNSVALKQFSHLVNDKSLYALGATGLLLLALIASEYFITLQKTSSISSAKDEVFAQRGLQSTMFQNRALLKDYSGTHERQTKLRLYASKILNLKLEKDVYLSLVELKAQKLKVEFIGVKKSDELNIIKELKSQNAQFESTLKDERLRLEIAL